MKKSIKITALACLLIVISAWVALYYVTERTSDIWWSNYIERLEMTRFSTNQRYDEEFMLTITLGTIERIEAGKAEEALQLNCVLLAMALKQIRPELIEPEDRRAELVVKIARAREAISKLESKGHCLLPKPFRES